MGQKIKAFALSIFWSVLPCFLAGGIVGAIFLSAFWYCLIGIAVLALFYCCLDRIPVRLFAGTMRGLALWPLLKYGYASTDKKPLISEEMVNEENEWRTTTYNHFYGDDR